MNATRKLRRLVVLTGVLSLFVVLLPAAPALAHGGLTYPATRTMACYVNGIDGGQGGDLDPTNPACIEAIAVGGKTPLWNWFGNLISDAGGRHREIIADGDLCGPSDTFDAYNLARTDWPTTRLQPGQTITMSYNAWAPHPGTWYQYVTRDGWDPSQPLGWDDLEPAPFDQVTNPAINGSGPYGAEYTWQATLPNKQGRHIIYSIWQRSDSPEAFYNCADVHFGSGNIQYEIGPDGAPVGDQEPEPEPTEEPTEPEPSEEPTEPEPSEEPTEPSDAACAVDYAIASEWSAGYVADVTVTNTGDSAIQGWNLAFSFGGDEEITNAWNSAVTQSGADVEVGNAGWNGTIAPGGSANFGFQVSRSGPSAAPSAFSLNGSACST